MAIHRAFRIAAISVVMAGGARAAPSAPPPVGVTVPAEIVAMLKEHRGRWRAEDVSPNRVEGKTMDASWECKAAADGLGNVVALWSTT